MGCLHIFWAFPTAGSCSLVKDIPERGRYQVNSYKLDYTLGIDQQKTLFDLARRCREINGWGEQEFLQYAATANSKAEIEMKLLFLQEQIPLLEDEN